MKYLITGGAGFIGSHLSDYLIERGHEVHVLDNLETGSIGNVAHLRDSERFTLTLGSVLDCDTLEGLVADVDWVIHLAAVVGVKRVMEQPVETIITNVQGSQNVLELCSRCGKSVLLASTSEVYGKSMDGNSHASALHEDDNLTLGSTKRRRWAYGCSKAIDEFLGRAYYEQKDLQIILVRFFNVIGPRQTGCYGMVVPRFVRQALEGEPLEVHGDGTQSRCFTHVSDAIETVGRLMKQPRSFGEIVNVGNDEPVTINELAARVIRLTGSNSPITHVPYEEVYGPGYEDMHDRRPDLSRLRRLVGVIPRRALNEALREVIAFYAPVLACTA